MGDPSPIIAASGSVGLFLIVSGLLFRMLQLQNRRDDITADDIRDLKTENAWCNRRVSALIFACQQGGIAIPQEVWDGPPQVVIAPGRPDRGMRGRAARRRARRDDLDPHNN